MTRLLATLLIIVALPASPVAVQQTISVDVDLVNIYFTVCNAKGKLIRNLDKDSFTVFEDNTPQLITHFSRETDLPLTLALVIDTSGSVGPKLDFEQEAAIEFLNSILRRGRDKAAIVTFDSAIEMRQNYTEDRTLLAAAVRHTRAGGGTALYDALHFVLNGPLAQEPGRRGIILLSDGDDNISRRSPANVLDAAQHANVTIYAISVNSIEGGFAHSRRGDGVLEMFTRETGGRAFFPKRAKDLPEYFAQVSDDLRSQYTIGYRSTNDRRDGSYRRIRIDPNNERYSVHSRSGYYAPTMSTMAR